MFLYNRGYFIKDNQDQEKDHSQNNDTAYLCFIYSLILFYVSFIHQYYLTFMYLLS